MIATRPISNTEDIIDSRQIIERIEWLESTLEDCEHIDPALAAEDDVIECDLWEDHEEIQKLKTFVQILRDEVYGDTPEDGITLISDEYFDGDFAEQEAEDCGMINKQEHSKWPFNHLDWDKAAEELKQDYTEVDFDGVTYWAR